MADEQLAKREAERAQKRALEEQDEELIRNDAKRRRSSPFEPDSAVSASRRMSTDHDSPRGIRHESPDSSRSWSQSRSRSRSISRSLSRSRSRSPHRDHDRSRRTGRSHLSSRDSRSPSVEPRERGYRDRSPPRSTADDRVPRHRRRYSSTSVASRDSRARLRDLSRSPGANARRDVGRNQGDGKDQRNRPPFGGSGGRNGAQRGHQARERSLSPFSKRLALTRAMDPARG